MITTIITTYCRSSLLQRAINSVLNQTYSEFQVCVYDNASHDDTEAVMQDFVKQDQRIKYHRHSENIGMMANYQFAFDQINTPYFNLLSDDDFLLPNFFETALKKLQEFPDAAFCACAVLQLLENGELHSDPLSFWKREGLYTAPEGMLHMIAIQKFIVPTGILFQKKIVENIKPNLNSDIQVFWDPDYLIRITSKYPFVITKKHCAIYLVHSNSYAYSVYCDIFKNISNVELYLKAMYKTKEGIKLNPFLTKFDKYKALHFFKKYVVDIAASSIKAFIQAAKYRGVHYSAMWFYKYFGFSARILYFHFIIIFFKSFDFFVKFVSRVRCYMARNKDKNHNHFIITSADLKIYQDYAVTLLKCPKDHSK